MTSFSNKAIQIAATFILSLCLSFAVNAQVGCTDSNACNYDPFAVTDNGLCTYTGYYIPISVGSGPAIRACSTPSGYYLPDQTCIETVINADSYCIETSWDNLCQDDYAQCLGCDPQIYIPGLNGFGPAVVDCSAPEGYVLADQSCANLVLSNDSYCSDTDWDFFCKNAYNECLYGCSNPSWFIPLPGNPTGMALYCGPALEFFELAANQSCASLIAETNPDCLTLWGSECDEAYENCTTGCTDPAACNYLPFASIEVNELCEYPGCLNYSACNYDPNTTCEDNSLCLFPLNPVWLVPYNAQLENLPAVLGCAQSPPPFYAVADQDCAQYALAQNPSCGAYESTGFDVLCLEDYFDCVQGFSGNGCSYPSASNYNLQAFNDDGSCVFELGSSCPGDITGDGVINTGDLQSLLAVYGTLCAD